MTISPRDEQKISLKENAPDGPINMMNLLKFKEFAEYPDGSDAELSGKEAYMRYGVKVAELIKKVGGEFLFGSEAKTLFIGDGELQWDMVGIVKYPSVGAFEEMNLSSEYAEIHIHREAGLAHQLLIQC
jgi:uncharacterized protein (DUF1330 family)